LYPLVVASHTSTPCSRVLRPPALYPSSVDHIYPSSFPTPRASDLTTPGGADRHDGEQLVARARDIELQLAMLIDRAERADRRGEIGRAPVLTPARDQSRMPPSTS